MSKFINALTLLLLAIMALCRPVEASGFSSDKLVATITALDRIVFDASFRDCDLDALAALTTESLEFYHDQSGITDGQEEFLATTRNGLCQLEYDARREPVPGSMQVFPLHDGGELYGAIQVGEHRFYAKYEGREEILTSTALFTHLWLLKDGRWKLSRVLSYDHRGPDAPARQSSVARPVTERGI